MGSALRTERDRLDALRRSNESRRSQRAFDDFMRRRAAEHRAVCAVFRIPPAPAELPPSAIEIASQEA